MKIKIVRSILAIGLVASLVLAGCKRSAIESDQDTIGGTPEVTATETAADGTASDDTTSDETATSTLKVTADMAEFKDSDAYEAWQDTTYTTVTFSGEDAQVEGEGTTFSHGDLTITQGGTYVISGELTDGSIIVEAKETEDVRIVLNGVNIHCRDGSAILCNEADKVIISLEANTDNTLSDGETYLDAEQTATIYSSTDLVLNGTGNLTVEANHNNAIQSKDDLRIMGGTYTITAADDGLVGKDKVAIADGTFHITAIGDGIKSTNSDAADKGFIYIEKGTFEITSGADGIQAETGMLLAGGSYTITADGGVQNAQTHPGMGGMSMRQGKDFVAQEDTTDTETTEESSTGSKGIKAGGCLDITGGDYIIDASNDTIHTNYIMTIDDGTFELSAGDDGIHADVQLTINGGAITVTASYEGLESADLIINGGTNDITASDDAINAAGGAIDSTQQGTMGQMPDGTMPEDMGEGQMPDGTPPEGMEEGQMPDGTPPEGMEKGQMPDATQSETQDATQTTKVAEAQAMSTDSTTSTDTAQAGQMQRGGGRGNGGGMGQMQGGGGGGMMSTSSGTLTITGGTTIARAGGDGIDVNGSVTMTGGTVTVEGPENDGNGALDYDGSFVVDGGTFLATGSSGMFLSLSDSSTQPFVSATFATQKADTTITIKDASGATVEEFTPSKQYASIIYSSDTLKSGQTYSVYVGNTLLSEQTL